MKNKSKILVTGGLGYIGSHTVVELLNQGFEVVIIDNLSNSRIEILDHIEKITAKKPTFYNFDILDKPALEKVFKEHHFLGVLHFAAQLLVGDSVNDPLRYYANNISGLINLLEVTIKNNCNNFIYSSSCTVYGEPEKLPVTEKSPIKEATSPYGSTKIMGEQIIKDTVHAYPNFSSISLRYFNPVGSHDSGLLGELSNGNPSHLFPIITQAIYHDKTLSIFGDNYNTKDGTAVRDYIHVVDLAKAHVKALTKVIPLKNKNLAFNVGTGNGFSVLEIIKAFEKESQITFNLNKTQRRKGDISSIWACTELAEKELNWKAQKSLTEMVASSLKWHQIEKEKGWV